MNALDGYAHQIKAMAADGLSDARIAEELPIDTDDQKVYRWRKKHGVEVASSRVVYESDLISSAGVS